MSRLQTIFILFLTLCVGNFFMVGTAFCQESWYAKADITKNKPVIKSLPETKIPVETVKGKKGGSNTLLLGILGVVLVGGVVAVAAGGGGGGGGGDSSDDGGGDTGEVIVSW
jgi:hypothetical protein